ncbi:MAG: type IV pilus secretin PilQ [Limnobacter sp.]|nr:type IV pilus secretin PilQ [Limnobacter sp.]
MLQDAATSPIMKVAMKEEMAQTEALKQAKPYTGPALMNASVAEKGEQGEVITLTFTQSDFETISEQKDSKLRVRIRGGKLGELGQEQTLKGTKTFTTARLYQGGQSLNLLLDLKDATYVITKQGNALQIALNQAEKKLPEVVNAPQDSVYGMQTGYSSSLPNGVSYDSPYKGKPITLSFKDADIRTVMQVFADFTDLNLVLSDGVTGKATVHLKEIPWDQALDIVMRSKNLVARYSGKVLLISTAQDAAAQADRSSVGQFRDELDPLVVRSFDISYQSTDALGKLLLDPTKNLISSRGSVITDERTSQLIVEDTAARVQKVAKLIEQLDKAAPQVMIEARVILADKNTSRELEASIRAGARALPGQTDSTLIGSIPVDFGNREFIDSTRGADTNAAYTIFNKSGSRFLNIRLRALEQSSKIKTVSNPKVVTTNKQAALIEQGTEIPYQVATSSGATSTEFREANLKLEVTPQITPDGSIMLDVDVSKDSVGQQTAQGLAINTRHVKPVSAWPMAEP